MKIFSGVLLLMLLLSACGKHERATVLTDDVNIRKHDFQIGDEWSLTPVNESDLQNSIFKIYSADNSRQGVAFYIGKSNETFLFVTNAHIINQYTDLCNKNVSIKDSKNENILICDKFIHSLNKSDISIVSMKKAKTGNFDTSSLMKLKLSKKEAFNTFEKIQLASIDKQGIIIDKSEDCKFLSSIPMLKKDIDLINPIFGEFLSLPVGCDAAHGHSGSPILNEARAIEAVLWTGKAPKVFYRSSEIKDFVLRSDQQVWTEFNLVTPSFIIFTEIFESDHWFETAQEETIIKDVLGY